MFSPVARLETVRLILALAAHSGWEMFHFDVKSSFLNGEIHKEVFVSHPEGYEIEGEEYMVYKLKKALYGLKEPPKAWYFKIDQHFKKSGFSRSESEHPLYRN